MFRYLVKCVLLHGLGTPFVSNNVQRVKIDSGRLKVQRWHNGKMDEKRILQYSNCSNWSAVGSFADRIGLGPQPMGERSGRRTRCAKQNRGYRRAASRRLSFLPRDQYRFAPRSNGQSIGIVDRARSIVVASSIRLATNPIARNTNSSYCRLRSTCARRQAVDELLWGTLSTTR